MLRELRTAGFSRRLTLFGWRHDLVVGKKTIPRGLSTARYRAIAERQQHVPTPLTLVAGKQLWIFEDRFFSDDEDLGAEDILALVRDRDRRKQRRLERARASLAAEDSGNTPRREPIPREVRLAVFERDGGRCVECASNFDIQYDHIIPFSMGGASTVENLQILCATCNQRKGATIS